ncbi:hypothetical protein MBLNU457_6548t1 [Dothideomycetes sp. NU457]
MEKLLTAEVLLQEYADFTHEERTVKGSHGDVILSIFRPKDLTGKLPGVYFIHGGGIVMGTRFMGVQETLNSCRLYGMVCISVEYRLAPDYPYPVPLEDCYDGLRWVGDNLAELEIDPEKLLLAGASGGGNLAAACALLVRDRGGPKLRAQLLRYPMLDSRAQTTSSKLYHDGAVWSAKSNDMAWKAYLGARPADMYSSPSHATDLTGLPPAFVDVGGAEIFTDEDVAYAQLLSACGVQTELHIWPGVFHGFSSLLPNAKISHVAQAAQNSWVGRVMSLDPRTPSGAKI